MKVVPRSTAMASRTAHVFVPKLGYLHAGPLAMPKVAQGGADSASPAAAAVDGSRHILKAPDGGPELAFTWIAREKAWERYGGRRMAFSAAYLAAHGWSYVTPA